MKTLKIEVTQEDIDLARKMWNLGNTGRASNCPVAQSLRRQGFEDVFVGHNIQFYDEDGYHEFSLTSKLRDFIHEADAVSDNVSPAKFTVRER